MRRASPSLLARFASSSRATAAIEFAFVVPVFLLLYVTALDLTLAFAFDRRLDNCVGNLGDLVAQMTTIDKQSVLEVFDARYAMLQPYDDSQLGVRISVLDVAKSGEAKVTWSVAPAGRLPALPKGTVVALPPGLDKTDEPTLIFAEGEYLYRFNFGKYGLVGSKTLNASSFARARADRLPTCSNC